MINTLVKKIFKSSTKDKIQLKIDDFDGAVAKGFRQTQLFIFVFRQATRVKSFKPETKH